MSSGVRSGEAVVGRINCQPVWWVEEADSIETERLCGTFPQSHTTTYYLLFNVPFSFQTGTRRKKLALWVHGCSARVRMTLEATLWSEATSGPAHTHRLPAVFTRFLCTNIVMSGEVGSENDVHNVIYI